VAFSDEKGNPAGQCSIMIKDGKVTASGQNASPALISAFNTIAVEFSMLVDTMVKAGYLDPMSRGKGPA
jgi:hypothetical protein